MLRRLIGEHIDLRCALSSATGTRARRSGPARAGDPQPRGERARRDAAGRPAHDLHQPRRARRGLLPAAPGSDARRARGADRRGLGPGHVARGARRASSSRSSRRRGRARARASASRRCSASSSRAAGTSSVDSEVGAGSTFRLFFPSVDEACRQTLAPSVARNVARGHETLLLVEDEDGVRKVAPARAREPRLQGDRRGGRRRPPSR